MAELATQYPADLYRSATVRCARLLRQRRDRDAADRSFRRRKCPLRAVLCAESGLRPLPRQPPHGPISPRPRPLGQRRHAATGSRTIPARTGRRRLRLRRHRQDAPRGLSRRAHRAARRRRVPRLRVGARSHPRLPGERLPPLAGRAPPRSLYRRDRARLRAGRATMRSGSTRCRRRRITATGSGSARSISCATGATPRSRSSSGRTSTIRTIRSSRRRNTSTATIRRPSPRRSAMRQDWPTRPPILTEASRKSYAGIARGFAEYSADEIQEAIAAYYAMVTLIDDEVGRILATLNELDLTRRYLGDLHQRSRRDARRPRD